MQSSLSNISISQMSKIDFLKMRTMLFFEYGINEEGKKRIIFVSPFLTKITFFTKKFKGADHEYPK